MRVDGPMRFLCDEMLRATARWLRAAGYDAAMAEAGRADAEIIRSARAEGRVLLTKDRALAAAAEHSGDPVLLLIDDETDGQARRLRDKLGVDWQHAPFTRCLIDNVPLRPATPEEAERMPSRSRSAGGPRRVCPACGRLYWPGGHVRRMQQRLARWQRP